MGAEYSKVTDDSLSKTMFTTTIPVYLSKIYKRKYIYNKQLRNNDITDFIVELSFNKSKKDVLIGKLLPGISFYVYEIISEKISKFSNFCEGGLRCKEYWICLIDDITLNDIAYISKNANLLKDPFMSNLLNLSNKSFKMDELNKMLFTKCVDLTGAHDKVRLKTNELIIKPKKYGRLKYYYTIDNRLSYIIAIIFIIIIIKYSHTIFFKHKN